MNSSKYLVSLSVISLSVAIIGTTLWLGYQATGEFTTASVLNIDEIPGIEEVTTTVNYENFLAEGDALFMTGYYTLAGSKFALAINEDPENPIAYDKLGKTYLELADYPKAVENFARATNLSPSTLSYAVNYGKSLIRIKNFDQAFDHFQSLTNQSRDVLYYRSILSAYRGSYDSARVEIQEAANYDGNVDPANLQAVNFAFQSFDAQQEGQTIFLEALLTKAMVDIEEYHLAEAMSLNILNKQSDYRDVWTLLGYSQLKLENYEEAKQSLDQAVKIDSIKPEIHYFLGLSHYFLEEYEDAVTRFELALLYGFEPENEPYRKIAESQLFLERYEESLAAYEYLVKIEHASVDDFVRPIWLAIEMVQDFDRALTLAQEAVTYFPGDAMSHNLLAWVYIEQGELELADAEITTTFQIDPALAEAHFNAGLLREKQENIDGAIWEYQKAYELAEAGSGVSEQASEKYNALVTEPSE
jgi:tetratricopeptide (TPR) repeat protein